MLDDEWLDSWSRVSSERAASEAQEAAPSWVVPVFSGCVGRSVEAGMMRRVADGLLNGRYLVVMVPPPIHSCPARRPQSRPSLQILRDNHTCLLHVDDRVQCGHCRVDSESVGTLTTVPRRRPGWTILRGRGDYLLW